MNDVSSESEEPLLRSTCLSMVKVGKSDKLFICMTCGSGFELIFY